MKYILPLLLFVMFPVSVFAGSGDINVMTFNVSHGPFPLNTSRNLEIIADKIQQEQIEVAALQEVPNGIDAKSSLVSKLRNRGLNYNAVDVGYEIGSLIIVSKYPTSNIKSMPTGTGRVILGVTVTKEGREVNIVTTHLDPDGGNACDNGAMVLPMLNSIKQMYPNLNVILTGDLNVGPNWTCFKENLINTGDFYETCDYGVGNCVSTLNENFCSDNWPQYSNWCGGPDDKKEPGNLDYVLAGSGYGAQATNAYVLNDVTFSDHFPVVANVKFADVVPTPSATPTITLSPTPNISPTPSPTPSTSRFDVNRDNIVNILDAIVVIRYIFR